VIELTLCIIWYFSFLVRVWSPLVFLLFLVVYQTCLASMVRKLGVLELNSFSNGIRVLLSELLGLMVTLSKLIGNSNLTSDSLSSSLVYLGLTIQL
jgi:hypothetical protein